MNLKINGKVFTSIFVGTGPSSYKKRIYRAAVSQTLRKTALDSSKGRSSLSEQGGFNIKNCYFYRHDYHHLNGIFKYIPETNHVSIVYNVAVILLVQFIIVVVFNVNFRPGECPQIVSEILLCIQTAAAAVRD
jgi:hypothetical protein